MPSKRSERDALDDSLEVWAREIPDLDPLTEGIIERIQILAWNLNHSLDETLETYELDRRSFSLLGKLRKHGPPYRVSAGKLAETLRLSSGAMTNRLDRMEAAGLVRRLPDPRERPESLARCQFLTHNSAVRSLSVDQGPTAGMLGPMTRASVLAGLLLAVLAGCAAWQPPNLTATFPAVPGDVDIGPLRVVLRDRTGLATGIDIATGQEVALGFPRPGLFEAVPGDPNAAFVSWIGGACSERARLVFLDANGGYELGIREDPTLMGMIGCPAVGVPRSVRIRFSQPIEPALVSVSVTYR